MRGAAVLCAILLLGACGGSGGGSPSGPPVGSGLRIATQALQPGNVGHSYAQRLAAEGATGSCSWWVSSRGEPLPAGLALTGQGDLVGTPSSVGASIVEIVAQDSTGQVAVRDLPIEVRDLQIRPDDPGSLLAGDRVRFDASGGSGGYRFELVNNRSGCTLSAEGDYVAGSTAGIDVVRALDADGFFEEVGVLVGDDPFAGFQAVWGATDVWYVEWNSLYDPMPEYSTDFDEVLVSLGLRRPESTSVDGTEEDRLARLLVIRRTLGHLSTYYGNDFDGSPRTGGLSISFIGPAGSPGSTTPAPGSYGSPGRFSHNSICVRYGPNTSVVGTAWLDSGNDSIENDCGNPEGTVLGVFANRLLGPYLSGYRNDIRSAPIDAEDRGRLSAMLSGEPPADARASAIFAVADGFGRSLAAVLAHEIGHSIGLSHSNPSDGAGDLMNSAITLSPSVSYSFNAGHWATLANNLPGPNR